MLVMAEVDAASSRVLRLPLLCLHFLCCSNNNNSNNCAFFIQGSFISCYQ